MPISSSFAKRLFPRLPEIANEFKTPIHILDEQGIREGVRNLQKTMSRISGFKEFFAVKACPIPAVLRILLDEGCGFDCSSIIELILAREAGAKPEDIMFTSNDTSYGEFACAEQDGGSITNLDDINFLNHNFFKENGYPETICFRVNPGPSREGVFDAWDPKKAKYGIMIEQVVVAYTKARKLGAKIFGIHAMIVSGDRDYKNHVITVQMLVDLAKELKDNHGIKISFMNMGGGIGIPYKPDDEEFDFQSFAEEVQEILDNAWKGKLLETPHLYMECGRCITGPHGVFVTRAINRKDIYQTHIGCEAAMTGNPRPAVYSAYHGISVVTNDGKWKNPRDYEIELVNITGPICENCDMLAVKRFLPKIHTSEMDGDFIVSHDTGAHAIAMPGNYNGRPRHGAVMLKKDGSLQLVMYHETIADLLRRTRGL